VNEDPIVEETRKAGNELFDRFGHDMHAVCEDLRDPANGRGIKTITRPPRPAAPPELKKKAG